MKNNIKKLGLIIFFLNNSFKVFSNSTNKAQSKQKTPAIQQEKRQKQRAIVEAEKQKNQLIFVGSFILLYIIINHLKWQNTVFQDKKPESVIKEIIHSQDKNLEPAIEEIILDDNTKQYFNNIISKFDKDIFEDLLYLKENNVELFQKEMNDCTDIWISLIKIIDTNIKLSKIKKQEENKQIINIIPEFKNLDLSKKEKIMEFIGMFLSKNRDIFKSNEFEIKIFNFLETNDMTQTLNIISTISNYDILIPLGKLIKLQLNNLDNTVKNRYIDLFKNLLPLCFIADSFKNDILIDENILQLYPTEKDKEKYVAIHNAQVKESIDLYNLTFEDFFKLKENYSPWVRTLKSPVSLQNNQIKKIRSYEDFKKFNNL